MNIPKALSGATLIEWACGAGALLAILLAAWWIIIGGPAHDRRVAAEAKVSSALEQSRTTSAAEAAVIIDTARSNAAASEAQTQETADALRKAPGADQRLDPALNRIARERLCKRPAYRGRPECL